MLLFLEQCLNGLQFGLLLFLLAAGLTLVFGIMDLVNLAHGSLYMVGAYFAATFAAWTGSFIAGALLALGATLLVGMAVEVVALRRLYGRDHLDHVLGTFGLILFFNELVRLIWGPAGHDAAAAGLAQHLGRDPAGPRLSDLPHRHHRHRARWSRCSSIVLVMRTRLGMLIRAGASNREMAGALGVNIKLLYTLVFGLGAALAALAGLMQAPILTVQIGMGENILILAFVVIIIGGIGSIRGAFVAAILVGLIDTVGRAFLPDLLRLVLSSRGASTVGAGAVVDADLSADGDRAGGAAGRACSRCRANEPCWLTPRNVVVAASADRCSRWCRSMPRSTGNSFLMTLFTRIVILAMAATSLNLILGYGGMVSFGHAVYLGVGGYAVGILAHEGVGSGFVQWPVALAASALFALIVGALSLRTRGVYFIMITLAFAQMVYYFGVGLDRYGGDDGLTIYRRSQFADLINLSNRTLFYYLCLALLLGDHLSRLAHGELALRHGDPGLALERPAHAGDRLPDLPLSPDLLRDRRHDLRARRRAARQPHRLHQPGHDALDALGRPHRDGRARRHGLALRPADRRGHAAGAGGNAAAR